MRKCLLIVLVGFLTACSASNDEDSEASVTQLNTNQSPTDALAKDHVWLDYADAKADANIALEKGDTRLLAFANRILSFPGLQPEKFESLKDTCGYRVLEGSGDMLVMGQDKRHLGKLREYAKAYNQVVYDSCAETNN